MGSRLLLLAGLALAGCTVNATGAKCESTSNCPPGEGCGINGRCSPAALCPSPVSATPVAGAACNPSALPVCGSGADQDKLTRCEPSTVSRDCYVWNEIDCQASGLFCDASAPANCACPALTAGDIFADWNSGSLLADQVPPTGRDTPAQCRFKSVSEAVQAAGPGHMVVRATGYAGTPMVFSETSAIALPAGVTLTTGDSVLTTTHYVLQAPDSSTTPFITLAEGATLTGWEVRNGSGTADAIRTNCATGTMVLIDTVKVSGTGTGAPPAKFKAGIHHGGVCSLLVNNVTITGVGDTGIVLDAGGPAVGLTNNVITGNDGTQPYSFPGNITRHGGGIVFFSSIPSSFVFQNNQVYDNRGDQIVVAVGSGTLNLTGGAASSDCGTTSNVIRCYDTGGKGIYAGPAPLEVKADFNEWPTTFPGVPDISGNVTGIGSWCDPVATRPACQ